MVQLSMQAMFHSNTVSMKVHIQNSWVTQQVMYQLFQLIPMNLKKSNFVKNSIYLIQITFSISSNPLQPNYNARKRDAQGEYLGIIEMASMNCVKDINFSDPVQMKKVQGDLMKEAGSEAQYISNKQNIQIDLLYFEWDMFIPTLERESENAVVWCICL